jgi:hypothetical protein
MMMILKLFRYVLVPALLVSLSGCVTVQNRYSVFGLDRFQTESLTQAKTWSMIFVGTVSLISMALGATGLYLAQRLLRWWKTEKEVPSSKPHTEATEASSPLHWKQADLQDQGITFSGSQTPFGNPSVETPFRE